MGKARRIKKERKNRELKELQLENERLREEIRKMNETREEGKQRCDKKLIKNVSGGGTKTYRVSIPMKWIENMEMEEKVHLVYDEEKQEIIIRKYKEENK